MQQREKGCVQYAEASPRRQPVCVATLPMLLLKEWALVLQEAIQDAEGDETSRC